jgi:molybdate transport system substrate-binding protein
MRILSTLAVKGVLAELLADATGIDVVYEPTQLLLARIARGEAADVAILTGAAVDDLLAKGVLAPGSKRDVAVSAVGVAVKAGAPKPDISTPEAVRALLLAVPTLCYSRSGASGLHFARVLHDLGIAEAVNAKATIIPSGFTAETLVDGRCAIAVQQVSELLVVPGIEVVGPLPDPIQETLTFSAGVLAGSAQSQASADWVASITRADLADQYRRHGLTLCA